MLCRKDVQWAGSTQADPAHGEKKLRLYTAEMLGKLAISLLLNMHYICRLKERYFGVYFPETET